MRSKITASSPVCTKLTLNTTTTIKAIATVTGFSNSSVATATYTLQVATPTSSPAAGTYTTAQSVTLGDAVSGATIYYTTNGSTPTTSSMRYTAPISVTQTTTIKAIATVTGWSNSAVGTATYTISP